MAKADVEAVLAKANVNAGERAERLSLADWHRLALAVVALEQ